VVADGDFREAVLGAVNYGRDSDSIAGMAGAIIGAMQGASGLPQDWVDHIVLQNKIDFTGAARELADLFQRDYEAAYDAAQTRHKELSDLMSAASRGHAHG
jgi:hypothetical protein